MPGEDDPQDELPVNMSEVIVVDDEGSNLRTFERIMRVWKRAGRLSETVELKTILGGQSAITHIRATGRAAIACVLTDVSMPVVDGTLVAAAALEADIPVAFLTSETPDSATPAGKLLKLFLDENPGVPYFDKMDFWNNPNLIRFISDSVMAKTQKL